MIIAQVYAGVRPCHASCEDSPPCYKSGMDIRGLNWNSALVEFGLGAFETMRLIDGRIPLLTYHLERLSKALRAWSLEELDLPSRWTKVHRTLPEQGTFRVKWLLGLESNGHLIDHIYSSPYQTPPKSLKLQTHTNFLACPQHYKSTQYAEHWLAHRHASSQGFDDVIYLTSEGYLTECSRYALCLIDRDKGVLSAGPKLDSVCHHKLHSLDPDFWEQRPIHLDEIKSHRRLWACNALHGLIPIQSICLNQNSTLELKVDYIGVSTWNKLIFQ